jgi:hypothetical protein
MTGYLGKPDFHDGHVVAVSQAGDVVDVTVEGFRGKRYIVHFEGVSSIESESPEGMMLYALSEEPLETEAQRRYIFINWYVDEPATPESKAYLRVVAKRLTVDESG